MKTLTLIFLLSQISYSQKSNEQIAVDYFIENILKNENTEFKKIKFDGYTESYTSGLLIGAECLTSEENNELYNGFKDKGGKIKIENASKQVGKGKSNLSMSVGQSLRLNSGKEVVVISLRKKNSFIWFYIILLKDSDIIDTCVSRALV